MKTLMHSQHDALALAERTEGEVVAAQGERMIEIRCRFFTNKLAENEGAIVPKHDPFRSQLELQDLHAT